MIRDEPPLAERDMGSSSLVAAAGTWETMMVERRLCTLVLLLAGGPAAAQDLPGNPERGRAIAEAWCIECHELVPDIREPSVTDAPPFQAVADDPAATETALRAFLQTPHAAMPNIRPTPEQTDDLIAYILSLKGHRPGT
jgi:mono/diheme cytochrome c family protein